MSIQARHTRSTEIEVQERHTHSRQQRLNLAGALSILVNEVINSPSPRNIVDVMSASCPCKHVSPGQTPRHRLQSTVTHGFEQLPWSICNAAKAHAFLWNDPCKLTFSAKVSHFPSKRVYTRNIIWSIRELAPNDNVRDGAPRGPYAFCQHCLQVYEFSLNVSKGMVDAADVYGRFRSDVMAVQVEVGVLF